MLTEIIQYRGYLIWNICSVTNIGMINEFVWDWSDREGAIIFYSFYKQGCILWKQPNALKREHKVQIK